jgi:trans-aconitate methyltransferase
MDKSQQAVKVFDKNAQRYQDRFMHMDLYNDGFDLFCRKILKQNPDVLDIACGPGNITKYVLQLRPDFKILGIDLALKMLELAAQNNPSATFKLIDVRTISTLESKYSGVICGFCIPYLSKEEAIKLIVDIAGILEGNGVLYISTMEDDYSKSEMKTSMNGEDQVFVYYHQADYLLEALSENGFSIISTKHQHFPTEDETVVTDLIIIAQKK